MVSVSQHGKWLNAFAAGMAALPAAGLASNAHAYPYRVHEDHVLGTSLDLVAIATGPGSAAVAASAARAEIRRLDSVLSGYDPESELSRLNRASGPVRVSPDLFAVLAAAETWRERTGSAFSGRLGDVRAAWAAREAGDPSEDPRLAAERAERSEVVLDRATLTVHRPAGLRFALDGVAKGYIIDSALEAGCRAVPDLSGLLVDIGGDLRCRGRGPGRAGWRVGVAGRDLADNLRPSTVLEVRDAAVASSGSGARDVIVEGRARSHLLVPGTGLPVEQVTRATVVAPDATTADALATAFAAMGPERSIAMADAMPGIEASLTMSDGTMAASRGWAGLGGAETSAPTRAVSLRLAQGAVASSGTAWPSGFAAAVHYEIPKVQSDNYRVPYVSIWITDEKRELVRTLLVLGNEAKYLDSNYVWWRRYGRKDTAVVDAVARPTRPPGRYTAAWDGRDDAGKPAPQGRYLVHMEATREHGGHSYAFGEITVGGQPADLSIPAKDELGPLEVKYGPGS